MNTIPGEMSTGTRIILALLALLLFLWGSKAKADGLDNLTIAMNGIAVHTYVVPESFPNVPGLYPGDGFDGLTGDISGLTFDCSQYGSDLPECNPQEFLLAGFSSDPFMRLDGNIVSFLLGYHNADPGIGGWMDIEAQQPASVNIATPEPGSGIFTIFGMTMIGLLALLGWAKRVERYHS